MKHKDILGSSETTRESPSYSFQFDNYKQHHQPEQKQSLQLEFFEWFIGFAEGDATFSMRQEDGRLRFLFEVGQKDPKVLYKIKKTLGFGRISSFTRKYCTEKDPGEANIPKMQEVKYWRYTVEDRRGLQRIMSIFNGNLVLPKRRAQFENWVFKTKIFHSSDFSFNPRLVLPSLTTAWISGFIEAEGCFYASFTNPSPRSVIPKRLTQKLTITQQDICGERDILKDISLLFGSRANTYLVKPPDCYRIEISSLDSHKKVVGYLQTFPLQGNKKIAFRRWWRVYLARLKGDHLDKAQLPKLQDLCKAINNPS